MKSAPALQAASPVLWEDSVRRMMNDGVDTFVEVGPGKVLCGFIKKVDRSYAPLTRHGIFGKLNLEKIRQTSASIPIALCHLKEVDGGL